MLKPRLIKKGLFLFFIKICFCQPTIPAHRISYSVSGHTLTVPYFRNLALGETWENVKVAIISIHGAGRNAEDHFELLSSLAANNETIDSTMIVAPLYLLESDVENEGLDSTVLFWPSNDWNAGDLSRSTGSNPRPAQISAFSVIDSIFHRIVQNNTNVEKIIFTGHSAGSQMVIRYAAGGRAQNDILQEHDIEFKYVSTNTPSFLYLDSMRVIDENSAPFQFAFQFGCGTANYYKYGLENMNAYMEETGATTIRNNYMNRNLIYLIGEFDTGGQSDNCARDIQGENRLLRSFIFFSYLGNYYGDSVYQNHHLAEIPNAYHDFEDMVFSDCGPSVYFGRDSNNCIYVDPAVVNNFYPDVDAGEDQTANYQELVLLDGSNSSDPDGSIITYLWTQILGLPVVIDSADHPIASFVTPGQDNTLRFVLTAEDNIGAISSDTTTVSVGALSTQKESPPLLIEHPLIFPNPFNGNTTIRFDGDINKYISVRVYDIKGREIRILAREHSPHNASNTIIWDAKDNNGLAITAGLYFVALETKDNTLMKKITYLK
ncbi:uncharacterized protein METZ01_LOCUS152766 [marine metagenome]|uniref:Secretion system C-terminal sorting domain-containing protein n=1 Tax=marine metagenome TaxID=408172 RepID=A0A382AFL5_9ZZZZ